MWTPGPIDSVAAVRVRLARGAMCHRDGARCLACVSNLKLGIIQPVLNQGDQGENLIPPSLILIPDIPDIPEVPWVPSGA
jgi:hypothetical protein